MNHLMPAALITVHLEFHVVSSRRLALTPSSYNGHELAGAHLPVRQPYRVSTRNLLADLMKGKSWRGAPHDLMTA